MCGRFFLEYIKQNARLFIDDGIAPEDILGQQVYFIGDNDYAADVERKINEASGKLFRKILSEIVDDICN